MNYSKVSCITVDVVFPAGVALGASTSSNFTEIDRNGKGSVVIRGTAIAGVFRHAYSEFFSKESSDQLFGVAIDGKKNEGRFSRIRFFDSILSTGENGDVVARTHNSVDRHWGRVTKHALFSIEACPPGAYTSLLIEIHGENIDSLREETQSIASMLQKGMIFGGNSNRGIGLMKMSGKVKSRLFELQDIDDHSDYLNFKRLWKFKKISTPEKSIEHDSYPAEMDTLSIEVDLVIPDGQDLLIADAHGIMQPQDVVAVDGKEYWRLPGASVRGVMKAFITNLASKQGEKVAYSLEQLKKIDEDDVSANQGWLFQKPAEGGKREPSLHNEYPVASLFGSLHAAGRLHISDSYVPVSLTNGNQKRAHVAVDSITGGAIEGMLFTNNVLTSEICVSSTFTTRILIKNPEPKDVEWIVSALKAVDSGFLRLGSSKASGRLKISKIPEVRGKLCEKFEDTWKDMS